MVLVVQTVQSNLDGDGHSTTGFAKREAALDRVLLSSMELLLVDAAAVAVTAGNAINDGSFDVPGMVGAHEGDRGNHRTQGIQGKQWDDQQQKGQTVQTGPNSEWRGLVWAIFDAIFFVFPVLCLFKTQLLGC